jgi:tetratricopeptide (TPR) repeat protein
MAMKAVAGMANPLLEARLVRTGTRLAFRHHGAVMDPIRRQLLFDFERAATAEQTPDGAQHSSMRSQTSSLRSLGSARQRNVQDRFLAAVQAEEAGEKHRAISIYEEIIGFDPQYAAAYINLGTIYFHLRQYGRSEELYRQATEADPTYVLAFFDLGNVLDELERLDESIAAYRRAVALAPRYADAHYNLALAYERKGQGRQALRHWQCYRKLDSRGPWAEHARAQIRKLLDREKLAVVWTATEYLPPRKGMAQLELV